MRPFAGANPVPSSEQTLNGSHVPLVCGSLGQIRPNVQQLRLSDGILQTVIVICRKISVDTTFKFVVKNTTTTF
jgi:hypothetical protein